MPSNARAFFQREQHRPAVGSAGSLGCCRVAEAEIHVAGGPELCFGGVCPEA